MVTRSADETLTLFKQVLNHRRDYVRDRLRSIKCNGREQQPQMERMLRSGMLSELTTVECILSMLESGDERALQYWPQAPEATE